MKWLKRSLLIFALVGIGIGLWAYFHPNPEKSIRKQLSALAQAATIESKASQLARIAAARAIPDYFTQDARLHINLPQLRPQSLEGREDISEAAAFYQSRFRAVRIEFLDLDIVVGPDKQSAQVELTAKATLPDEDLIAQEFKFLMKHVDGHWLISRVETVKPFN